MKSFRKTYWVWLFLAFILGNASHAEAQEDYPLGSWYIYNGFFNFSPKTELFFETQLRTWEVVDDPQTFLMRPYFSYNVADNF